MAWKRSFFYFFCILETFGWHYLDKLKFENILKSFKTIIRLIEINNLIDDFILPELELKYREIILMEIKLSNVHVDFVSNRTKKKLNLSVETPR